MLSQSNSVDNMGETEILTTEKSNSPPVMRGPSDITADTPDLGQNPGNKFTSDADTNVEMTETDKTPEKKQQLQEDSCGSEDEGRLHIETSSGNPPPQQPRLSQPAKKYPEDDAGSEGEDEFPEEDEQPEDLFDADERTIRQHLYHQQQRQQQQAYACGAFGIGNLTVTKFPVNGHGQGQAGSFGRSHHHHDSSAQYLARSMLKRDREGMPTGRSNLLMCPPQQSSPLGGFPHNLNNNSSSVNHNLGLLKGGLLSASNNNGHGGYSHPGFKSDQGHSDKFISQRRGHHHSQAQAQALQQFSELAAIKTERKSPNYSDVKPDSLGTGSLNHLSRSLGTALLNLASLGNLAALQQQQHGQGRPSSPSMSPLRSSPLSSTLPSAASMTPLNLTNGSGGGLNNANSASLASITDALANNSNLAQYISQQQSNSINNGPGSFLSQAGMQDGNTLPQLILASGNIVQGIQGAQLLIPTSQGLMTQTVLTIPITQPASPSSLLGSSTSSMSPPSSGTKKGSTQGHSHIQQPQHPRSGPSPVTPMVPPSGSPSTFSSPASHMNLSSQAHIPNISDKLDRSPSSGLQLNHISGMNFHGSMNGHRMSNGRRESSSSAGLAHNLMTSHHHNNNLSSHHHHSQSICPPSQLSPCSSHSRDSCDFLDRCSDNDDDQNMEGINLDEIKEFAKAFKLRRLSLGLTQTQVGQALSVTEGPAYSQSAICSALAWQLAQSHDQSNSNRSATPPPSMFEKLDITPKSAQKIKPVLERWMKEAEDRYRNGHQNLNEFVGMEPSKKRKRRTSFTPQALEILNTHFERNTHPSGAEITTLSHQLGYEREVIRIWFCNKRQALKNTVRMMSKSGGGSPI